MKITKEADYALRIVAMLAGEESHVEARQIAEKNEIPYRFTLKILRKMVAADLIKSYRGANGGYALNKTPEKITFKDVIETIDGKIAINRCVNADGECSRSRECEVKKRLFSVQKIISDELEKISFLDIVKN